MKRNWRHLLAWTLTQSIISSPVIPRIKTNKNASPLGSQQNGSLAGSDGEGAARALSTHLSFGTRLACGRTPSSPLTSWVTLGTLSISFLVYKLKLFCKLWEVFEIPQHSVLHIIHPNKPWILFLMALFQGLYRSLLALFNKNLC